MTKYTIRYLNRFLNRWSIYHSTFDISDAYNVHAQLLADGCRASITSEYVQELST